LHELVVVRELFWAIKLRASGATQVFYRCGNDKKNTVGAYCIRPTLKVYML